MNVFTEMMGVDCVFYKMFKINLVISFANRIFRRSNMITNIATVAVYVGDQQKAKNFWIEKVGFEVKASFQWALMPSGLKSRL